MQEKATTKTQCKENGNEKCKKKSKSKNTMQKNGNEKCKKKV